MVEDWRAHRVRLPFTLTFFQLFQLSLANSIPEGAIQGTISLISLTRCRSRCNARRGKSDRRFA